MNQKWQALLDEFHFNLPPQLIATTPNLNPEEGRLLVIDRKNGSITEMKFSEIVQFFNKNDIIISNNSNVEYRRVFLKRSPGGARIESIFLKRADPQTAQIDRPWEKMWEVLLKKRKRLNDGELLDAERDETVTFKVHKLSHGKTFLEEPFSMTPEIFKRVGQVPIPPYMRREQIKDDQIYYKNYFGSISGSVAAPTSTMHFTDRLKKEIERKEVLFKFITLHIGYGTFAPLQADNFENNQLHSEWYQISEDIAELLRFQEKNKRIFILGTTALRALETVNIRTKGQFNDFLSGDTDMFFYPPHKISWPQGLITNFHLPGSSLILLVSCFLEKDLLLKAYKYAIEKKFRFYSYGDAMLIL